MRFQANLAESPMTDWKGAHDTEQTLHAAWEKRAYQAERERDEALASAARLEVGLKAYHEERLNQSKENQLCMHSTWAEDFATAALASVEPGPYPGDRSEWM